METISFRMILSLVTILTPLSAIAVEHMVTKGETIESIARTYGTTQQAIKDANPIVEKSLFPGLLLDIPPRTIDASTVEYDMGAGIVHKECMAANQLLYADKNREAQKAYSVIIKQLEKKYPCTDAYFGRGISYYKQGNWGKSIQDFERVLSDKRCSETLRSHSSKLLTTARARREEELRAQAEAAGQFIGALNAAMANAVALSQQSSGASGCAASASRSRSGGSSVSSSRSSSASGGSAYGQSVKPKSSDCESLRVNNGKWYCANTGRCGMCGGDGLMDGMFGQGANSHKCTLCGGTGRCKYCK